jgi:hypothetical protein
MGGIMWRKTLVCWLAMCAPFAELHAANVTYKFVGTPLTTHSGCLTQKNHISMSLTLAHALAPNMCSTPQPVAISFSDGLNNGSFKPAEISGIFYLCTSKVGAITAWNISAGLAATTGKSDFTTGLFHESATAGQSVNDFECAGFGSGTASLAGKWSHP